MRMNLSLNSKFKKSAEKQRFCIILILKQTPRHAFSPFFREIGLRHALCRTLRQIIRHRKFIAG